MKATFQQIIEDIRTNLPVGIGRHLYGVFGSYEQLDIFNDEYLRHAKTLDGTPFPLPVNLSRTLLERIQDGTLKKLVKTEGNKSLSIIKHIHKELNNLMTGLLIESSFVILKNMELIFSFEPGLDTFREKAVNTNHVLLLLPGSRQGNDLYVYNEFGSQFARKLPKELLSENFIWEINNG